MWATRPRRTDVDENEGDSPSLLRVYKEDIKLTGTQHFHFPPFSLREVLQISCDKSHFGSCGDFKEAGVVGIAKKTFFER